MDILYMCRKPENKHAQNVTVRENMFIDIMYMCRALIANLSQMW